MLNNDKDCLKNDINSFLCSYFNNTIKLNSIADINNFIIYYTRICNLYNIFLLVY